MAKKQETAVENTDKIAINNIGPIENFEFDFKPGRITVLTGYNGHGKSTALEAVDSLVHDTKRLESRDGSIGGNVIGLGVTVRVGRGGQNRRTGKAVVTTIEDKLSIADFVDPKIKDPVAADTKRLKSLVGLAGFRAHQGTFAEIAKTPEIFRSLVKPESLTTTDPVEMAAMVKRDIEAHARKMEDQAKQLSGEINGKMIAVEKVDLTAEHDKDKLNAAVEEKIRTHAGLVQSYETAAKQTADRAAAQANIEKAKETLGATPAELEINVQKCAAEREAANNLVADLRQKLAAAESDLKLKLAACDNAVALFNAAKHSAELISGWQKIVDAVLPIAPSSDEIDAAAVAVKAAQDASETGVLVRQAIETKKNIDELESRRAEAENRAEEFRHMAQSTLDVLAMGVKELIPGIKIDKEQRIVVPHYKRGECYFSELSDGERWRLAIDLAVEAFRMRNVPGILVINQTAWEGLDGRNRQVIIDKVAETDLRVVTAEKELDVDADYDLKAQTI